MDVLAVVAGGAAGGAEEAAGTFDWIMLFVYLGLALGVSFLCSMLEAGILSIPHPYVMVLAEEGRKSGKLLDHMKSNLDRPLAAILSLNTVAHTVGAAGVGAQVQIIFGNQWVAIASVIVTLLILVLSEIIPKSLGAAHAKRLSGFTAYTIQVMIWISYPLVVVLEAISRRISGGERSMITREEVKVAAELGEHAGALEEREMRVIHNLLRLSEVKVRDVMTPRPVVFMLPENMTAREAAEKHHPIRFSRIPIFRGGADQIVGLVQRQALLHAASDERGDQPLETLLQPIHVVPDLANVADALDEFIRRREHLFQVTDEHGGTAGIITLEDTLETLLGVEIVDETDTVEDMRKLARQLVERRRNSER